MVKKCNGQEIYWKGESGNDGSSNGWSQSGGGGAMRAWGGDRSRSPQSHDSSYGGKSDNSGWGKSSNSWQSKDSYSKSSYDNGGYKDYGKSKYNNTDSGSWGKSSSGGGDWNKKADKSGGWDKHEEKEVTAKDLDDMLAGYFGAPKAAPITEPKGDGEDLDQQLDKYMKGETQDAAKEEETVEAEKAVEWKGKEENKKDDLDKQLDSYMQGETKDAVDVVEKPADAEADKSQEVKEPAATEDTPMPEAKPAEAGSGDAA